jgi:hypothetical protein
VHGLEDLAFLAPMLAPAVATCKDINGDLLAVTKWAQIFEHPAHLIERVSKNWVMNYTQLH